ncbi:MAG: type II secretion system minor pseudopilin GspJ, partial [Plesiomonas shigelloides]
MTTSQQYTCCSWRRPSLRRASQLGFTLLELLVAIAVFALLSLGIYQVVDGVRRADQTSAALTERMNSMQRAMQLLHNDFTQAVARRQRSDGLSRTPLL